MWFVFVGTDKISPLVYQRCNFQQCLTFLLVYQLSTLVRLLQIRPRLAIGFSV